MGDADAKAANAGITDAKESFMLTAYEDIRESWSD
jgi:hypothetical protein